MAINSGGAPHFCKERGKFLNKDLSKAVREAFLSTDEKPLCPLLTLVGDVMGTTLAYDKNHLGKRV